MSSSGMGKENTLSYVFINSNIHSIYVGQPIINTCMDAFDYGTALFQNEMYNHVHCLQCKTNPALDKRFDELWKLISCNDLGSVLDKMLTLGEGTTE